MICFPRATAAFLVSICLALASCATLRNAGKASVNTVKNSGSATASKIASITKKAKLPDFSVASLMPGPKIKVVEVREDELQELPTGHELAQAHQKKRRNNFWIFGGPVDFEEPTLPEAGSELDGSLLPPRMP